MAKRAPKADDAQTPVETQPTIPVTPEPTPEAPAKPEEKPPVPQVGTALPPIAPLPEPSQEVLDNPPSDDNGAENGNRSPTGELWDPAIHEDPPRIAARGSWARKRGGARGKSVASSPSRANKPTTDEPALTPQEIDARLDATAALASGTLFLCGEMLVGECMKPEDSEREGITTAFRDYFRATGNIEIPPWVGLLGAVGLYVGRRWTHPQFKEKRAAVFGGAKEAEKSNV